MEYNIVTALPAICYFSSITGSLLRNVRGGGEVLQATALF